MTTMVPIFKWAQDKENIFLTIEVENCTDAKINVTNNNINFNGTSKKRDTNTDIKSTSFLLDLELSSSINAEKSRYAVRDRAIEFVLPKSDTQEWWNVLPKDKLKFKNVCKADWDKWRDEEDDPVDQSIYIIYIILLF